MAKKRKLSNNTKQNKYLKRQQRYFELKRQSMSKKDIEKREKQQAKRVAKSKEAVTISYKSSVIAKPKLFKGSGNDLKNEINATMKYIADEKNINYNWELSERVNYAMQKLLNVDNNFKFEAGKDYGAFEIAHDWDGNQEHIIGHVKFNDLSNSNYAIDQSLRIVVNSDWGSEERHAYAEQEASKKRYDSIIKSKVKDGKTRKEIVSYLTGDNLALLEQIMYKSEMWRIVGGKHGLGTKYYDSEGARKDWGKVHDALQTMLYEGTDSGRIKKGHLDEIKSMLDNYEEAAVTMNDLVSKINEYIDLYTK